MPDLSGGFFHAPIPDLQHASLTMAPPSARFILRGIDAAAAAGKSFGASIPVAPMTASVAGERVALWLGPDEWLLLAPESDLMSIGEELRSALSGVPHALVDVSDRQVGLLLEGVGSAWILNAGVPLDLSLRAFPGGTVTRTVFEKTEIVLWRSGPDAFRLEVWRSFAPYLLALLQAADRDAPLPTS
jgi:sarcosine oxidase subunit gamma